MSSSRSLPVFAEKFLDFSFTIDWDMKSGSKPGGFFKILYPISFPLYNQPPVVPITSLQATETVTANCCIDPFFVDSAFRNPFVFTLLYSRENPETQPDVFAEDKIQLDGSVFFLPDRLESSVKIENFQDFATITFSAYCEAQILGEEVWKAFAPVFIHFQRLSSLPPAGNDAPMYYACTVNDKVFNILDHGVEVDVVIPLEYRKESDVTFEVHNQEKCFPTTPFVGSGVLKPFTGKAAPDASCGTVTFQLLVDGKRKEKLQQSGNGDSFKKGSYEISFYTYDPSSEIEPVPPDRGPLPRPNPEKVKPEEKCEGKFNLEKKNVKLIRWVFSCSRADGTWNYATKILDFVKHHHATSCKCSDPNAGFEQLFMKNKDVITGIHIMTPGEQIIILETRGQEPMGAAKGLEKLFTSFDPKTHVLGNRTLFYFPPRFYLPFDPAIQKISIPLPMKDLLRIDGLYYPKSPNYKFYPILTKLGHIMECCSLSEMENGSLFPTVKELQFLMSKASAFYTIPFQIGMPPAVITIPHGDRINIVAPPPSNHNNEESIQEIDIPNPLISFAKRGSLAPTIITPSERLTNYSLKMTANQRRTYKMQHARAEKLKREDEWFNAVDKFNRSQERMTKTFLQKSMKLMGEGSKYSFDIAVPPCETLITLTPRRNIRSQRTQAYAPIQPPLSPSTTSPRRIAESARNVRTRPLEEEGLV